MKLFLTISGILFLCVIVVSSVIYATIGVLPTQQSSTEATVPSQDSVLKKKKKSCSCCPTREERMRRAKHLREKMEQAWAEQEQAKHESTKTP